MDKDMNFHTQFPAGLLAASFDNSQKFLLKARLTNSRCIFLEKVFFFSRTHCSFNIASRKFFAQVSKIFIDDQIFLQSFPRDTEISVLATLANIFSFKARLKFSLHLFLEFFVPHCSNIHVDCSFDNTSLKFVSENPTKTVNM